MKNFVRNNLFDPERGADKTREAEAVCAATRRIHYMVLVGNTILAYSQYGILQDKTPILRLGAIGFKLTGNRKVRMYSLFLASLRRPMGLLPQT
jgi:hypothetical protein